MNYQIAAATTAGADHLRAGGSGQDAWHVESGPGVVVAVVADGCGSAPHSEVGSRIGAAIFARALLRHRPDWDAAAAEAMTRIRAVVEAIGGSFVQTIEESFLFTIVAAVVTEDEAVILSCGDGAFGVDDQTTIIGPFPGNAPPYFAYGLLDGVPSRLNIERQLPSGDLKSLFIATDGAVPMIQRELLDSTVDRLFTNPDMLRRRLFRSAPSDDATVILLRRNGERPWLA